MELVGGTIVAGRYRLDERIGEGGMGVVWSATHVLTRRQVALKFLRESGPAHTRRFLREARIAGTIRHPNIVDVHDIVVMPQTGAPVMVMELLAGESLDAKLHREGRIGPEMLCSLLLPAVSAIGSAHALGVVHRDLKPDNIFLSRDAHGEIKTKVLDFGIAKLTATEGDAASTSKMTQTGALMGTPFYMSPEQIFGDTSVDHRADVWALGVIIYQCLAGQRPFAGENFGQIFKGIAFGEPTPLDRLAPSTPPALVALVHRMLQRERDRRPADLREVFAALSLHTTVRPQPFGAPEEPLAASIPPDAAPMPPSVTLPLPPSVKPPVDPLGRTDLPGDTMLAHATSVRAGRDVRRPTLVVAGLLTLAIGGLWWTRAPRPPAQSAPMEGALAPSPSPPPAAPAQVFASAAPPVAVASAVPARPPTRPTEILPRATSIPAPSASQRRPLPGGVHGDSPY